MDLSFDKPWSFEYSFTFLISSKTKLLQIMETHSTIDIIRW